MGLCPSGDDGGSRVLTASSTELRTEQTPHKQADTKSGRLPTIVFKGENSARDENAALAVAKKAASRIKGLKAENAKVKADHKALEAENTKAKTDHENAATAAAEEAASRIKELEDENAQAKAQNAALEARINAKGAKANNVTAQDVNDSPYKSPSPASPGTGADQKAADQKARDAKRKTGEEMNACQPFHVDEIFWMCALVYLCCCGDFWVLGWVLGEPLAIYIVVKACSTPGDLDKTCNNMVPTDTRMEGYQAPQSVIDTITSGKSAALLTPDDRPNSEWVGYFSSSLAPETMDQFDKKFQRVLAIFAQGGEYLPKGSDLSLAMIIYSFSLGCWGLSLLGPYRALKYAAIAGSHINMAHIFRDHSVSGYTHHTAHNVGEFDKLEFIAHAFKKTMLAVVLHFTLRPFLPESIAPVLDVLVIAAPLQAMAQANHTLCHYSKRDIKGKNDLAGALWKLVLGAHEALGTCKILCSREYHAKHHFHNEMAYPAILIVFNEYLNSKALVPFLTRRMAVKPFKMIEAGSTLCMFAYLCLMVSA